MIHSAPRPPGGVRPVAQSLWRVWIPAQSIAPCFWDPGLFPGAEREPDSEVGSQTAPKATPETTQGHDPLSESCP